MRSAVRGLAGLVLLTSSACASARAKELTRKVDTPTAVAATQTAGLPETMGDASPDNVERRFGIDGARVRAQEKRQRQLDQRTRVDVIDVPTPAPAAR